MSIKVAVVNDCELVVAGIHALLGPYARRVRVVRLDAGSPPRAQVDVLLHDPLFPSSGPSLYDPTGSNRGRLVALGWDVDPYQVRAVIRAGVDGYIFKGLPPDEFVDAIERVHRGELVVPAGAGPVDAVSSGRWPGAEVGLSSRESDVMMMICQGLSNREIAGAVFVSVNTVRSYIRSVYGKIGVKTRAQAVIWGLANDFGSRSSPVPPSSVPSPVVRIRQPVA